ncbi:hypothetical protein ACFLUG_00220 [Chloroflexota bacterium]
MNVEVIPQVELNNVQRIRIGDVISREIAAEYCREFHFASAFIRMSGWGRLANSIESLLNRGGIVSGTAGVDDGITSIEALEAIRAVSQNSTIFYTTSGFIFHPKIYLMKGDDRATAVIGSENLTRNGLFRNVELATAIYFDLNQDSDREVYSSLSNILEELLDNSNDNVQIIDGEIITILDESGIIDNEVQTHEPGPVTTTRRAARQNQFSPALRALFPPLHIPVAPPINVVPPTVTVQQTPVPGPTLTGITGTFIMQLSPFDSSHRTGVPGTPEILIPHGAIGFFPILSVTTRKYPDAVFDVILNTSTGQERHSYRLWYYEERATGTKIDEYRFRLNHDTIDLTNAGGGDLIVINKLAPGSDPEYEVTILPNTDVTFPVFLGLCTNQIYDKRWGII